MKRRPLQFLVPRGERGILPAPNGTPKQSMILLRISMVLLTLIFFSHIGFGQSETHNMTTYDTIIPYRGTGSASQNWVVRITRPVNFFTSGNADTASRPAFVTMQGDGEISGGTSGFMNMYGPHYWLANGWDGGVSLGNGTHYPILITIQQNAVNTRPNLLQSLMDTLYKEFHPRSVHFAGLSGGSEVLGWLMEYQSTLGDEHNMARVNSFVNLQGVGPSPSTISGVQPLAYPRPFGHWARKYGGKYWSLIGTGDQSKQSCWEISENMNDSVPGSAYLAYESIDTGKHCCWNDMYTPFTTNWTNQLPLPYGNSAITSNTNHPNTAGTYFYSAATGSNLFQWMLRQGDTTLTGQSSSVTFGHILVGSGEYAMSYLDSFRHWYALGDLHFIGNGLTGTAGLPYKVVTSPANLSYKASFGGLHDIAAIDSAGGLWLAGDNSQGQLGQGNKTVNNFGVNVATDSAGNPFTNISLFAFYYTSNFSEGWYAAKTDGTLWMCGSGINGMRGDGTVAISVDSIVSRPRQVLIPGGRTPKQITGGQRIMILMTDGTVWTVGKANNTTDYGFTMSGNLFASLQQVPGLTAIVQIAGPMSYNYALRNDGHLFGWGTFGSYMGNWGNPTTGGGTKLNTPTDLKDSVVAYLPAPIAEIKTNQNVTVARCTDGTLWSWGDNSQGSIGNGQELDFRSTTKPFAWDFLTGTKLVRHPIRITGYSDFDTVFVNNNFGFNVQARRSNGQLVSWGRNKGGVLGNGQISCSAGQAAVYPNALDVVYPTVMNPLTVTAITPISCPICRIAPGDTTCGDGGCAIPTVTTTCNAGNNQTITGTTATLTGTNTTNGVILSTAWSQVSGPNTAGFDLQSAPTVHLTGLTNGSYVFSYSVIDNGHDTATSTTTVVVGGETHDFITYDTTINYICMPGYNGCVVGGVQQYFTLRITRPRNYFTAGNADTASRPLILTMPTDSAVTDTSWLSSNGPHYWLNHGWDGSVTLENGKHYPLLITIIATSAHVRPFSTQPLMDTLIKYFHPLAHSIHLMGTSGGVSSLGYYIWFQATAGDEHNMANVRSFVDLQGVGPSTNFGVSTIGYPNAFGYWARKYGGKFFGLEGSNASRNEWQISENMNDSLPGSAYFSFEKAGGGLFGSYDSLYDPSVTNWTDTIPFGNAFIAAKSPHVNTRGTYRYDPSTGMNIFQWALRQGDTTLAGSGTTMLAQPSSLKSGRDSLIAPPIDAAGNMPLVIYPNPSSRQGVMLTFRNAVIGKVSIMLVNEAGTVVHTYEYFKPDVYFLQQLPVEGLRKGVYFIKVSMPGYQATRQMIRL